MSGSRFNSLYESGYEHDACGCGLICHPSGKKSHEIIQYGLEAAANMKHRCASGADINSGDGAGMMLQIPHEFFSGELAKMNKTLPPPDSYGVGQLFISKSILASNNNFSKIQTLIEELSLQQNFEAFAWREVPIENSPLGQQALEKEPLILQVFFRYIGDIDLSEKKLTDNLVLERQLFLLRRKIEKEALKKGFDEKKIYFCSLSSKKIVYKGMLLPTQLGKYFLDLKNASLKSAFAIIHTRFSTNTIPEWHLAHPFRYISHNGEINTLKGNINWLKSRYQSMASKNFSQEELHLALPLGNETYSDSMNLDLALELLTLSGRSIAHATCLLMPEADESNPDLPKEVINFQDYNASFSEPWDGPASIYFSDGNNIGGKLDRNGLRPAHLTFYRDDLAMFGSESGAISRPPSKIEKKDLLKAGEIIYVDLDKQTIWEKNSIKKKIAKDHPYKDWIKSQLDISNLPKSTGTGEKKEHFSSNHVTQRQRAFGYTQEEIRIVFPQMVLNASDPVYSMGNDSPLAVLSNKSQNFFNYFHQLFAQVTNPPIDSIRERSFMSLKTHLGMQRNWLADSKDHAKVLRLLSPILSEETFAKIFNINTLTSAKEIKLKCKLIPIVFHFSPSKQPSEKTGKLKEGLEKILKMAEAFVEEGANILILSDQSQDKNNVAIPSLLAVASIHHHLIRQGLRSKTSLVLASGEPRQSHHYATLLGYGCNAIYPYMAFETVKMAIEKKVLPSFINSIPDFPTKKKGVENYVKAIEKGLLKIIAKMGISTIAAYQGAQIFESVGISEELIEKYFTGTSSKLGGIGLEEIEEEALIRHRFAFHECQTIYNDIEDLDVGGYLQWRQRGEKHLFSPMAIHTLQYACRNRSVEHFKKYSNIINSQEKDLFTIRGLMDFSDSTPIDKSEVEPKEAIFKRFVTGAMSMGSISTEAHSMLAVAMNRIGGKSNTGEGGEDPQRFVPLPNGDSQRSAIKQVASGRFGVSSEYLFNADEIQIKIAQGAKPGEGGQLPGHKVDHFIAKLRHSTPGVSLISPPPHHDIYSIEDLAQLILDLKRANPKAEVSVKLVSESGVGTVACGVAKCIADRVIIAGYDGGTGASPVASIKNAGLPWEIGLSETHQTLVKNKLRSRIKVQTDGQIKTGRDLAIATLLGAEEWGVASAALVSMGCIMMRKCHLNTCPVGIATQDIELRKMFNAQVEDVTFLFEMLAEELREIMAKLGFRTIDEMVGRADKLYPKKNISHWKAKSLNLNRLLYFDPTVKQSDRYQNQSQRNITDEALDHRWFPYLLAESTNDNKGSFLNKKMFENEIKNTDLTVGAMTSYGLQKLQQEGNCPTEPLCLSFTGISGQSFGAFASSNISLTLEGGANDYFAKGLSGASITVYPFREGHYQAEDNIIIGNVALYGATSGEVFINGKAGERFAVRNSGAIAVVEGIGSNGCEYMTGGKIIVIGPIGANFAAGMSGGVAYLWSREGVLTHNINKEMVDLEKITDESDKSELVEAIEKHFQLTKSNQAKFLLANMDDQLSNFVKIMPIDYKLALEKMKKEQNTSKQTIKTISNL